MSNANEPDSVNTGALATTIGVVAFATLGIALTVTSLVRQETKVLGDARQGTQDRSVRELRADQLGVLEATPTWKDKASGVVTLPIGRAMEWMVEAVRKNPKALSPWHPPAAEAMGGAGPESARAPAPTGTGGTSAAPAEEPSSQGPTAPSSKRVAAPATPTAPTAPAAPVETPAPAPPSAP